LTGCETIPYRAELREEVAELHARSFGGDPAASARYIRWKYEESSYIAEPLLYLARVGTRVVGMRGAYATVWDVPGAARPLVLPCFGDTVVDASYTSRGVFAALMEFALGDLSRRRFPYALNLGATPVTLLNSLATGWRAVGRPIVLRRLSFGRRAHDRAAAVPALRRTYRKLRTATAAGQAAPRGGDPFTRFDASAHSDDLTLAREPLPEAMAALAAETACRDRLRPAADASYLRWRFADPWAAHRFVFAHDDRGLAAYLVLRGIAGHSGVVVVDWQARSPTLLRRLLTTAVTAGRWPETAVWSGRSEPGGLDPFLREGFATTPASRAAGVLVRSTTLAQPNAAWRLDGIDLLDERSWELRLLPAERGLVDSPALR